MVYTIFLNVVAVERLKKTDVKIFSCQTITQVIKKSAYHVCAEDLMYLT